MMGAGFILYQGQRMKCFDSITSASSILTDDNPQNFTDTKPFFPHKIKSTKMNMCFLPLTPDMLLFCHRRFLLLSAKLLGVNLIKLFLR
jgi:hypothetical protein